MGQENLGGAARQRVSGGAKSGRSQGTTDRSGQGEAKGSEARGKVTGSSRSGEAGG